MITRKYYLSLLGFSYASIDFIKGSKSRNSVFGLVREFRSPRTHRGNLLGLKGVVGSPVVQVMTQTPNNQSKTFQIAHKLIHTSSLLNRNAPEI